MLQTAAVCSLNMLSDATEGHPFDFLWCFFNPVSGKLETVIGLGEYMSCLIPLSPDVREEANSLHTKEPAMKELSEHRAFMKKMYSSVNSFLT
ncbi:hypothetical protein V6N12_068534 [Hibiscus sabdariffa]|uniref:Uncharacterized protein n=1 Tax=Hibiscus sabdariffa TaxID=183260 RepID=A0ABR2FQA4_9ROSI